MTATRKKTKTGFHWVFFGTAGQNIMQFLVLLILARLISPKDFGLVSAAMIIVGFIRIFSEFGVGPAIVQKKELTKTDVGTGKVISALIGILMGVIIFLSANLFESFMRIDGLAHVVRILSFVLPLSGLSVIGQSLLQRDFEFKKYILCIFFSTFISQILIAVPLAFLGFGYYALVVGTVSQSLLLLFFVSYLTRNHGRWTFNLASAKHISNYGFGQSLGKFANYIAGQSDNFIIGRYLGAASLGLYGRAYQILMVPTGLIGTVLDKVMFPVFAKIQENDEKLADLYVLSMSIIAMLSIPITAFAFVSSEKIILLLLGEQWIATSPILKILICILFFRISYKVSDTLSRAKGSVYRRAWRQALYAIIMLSLSYLGSLYGLKGVAIGVSSAIVINYLLMLHLAKHLINFSYKQIASILLKNTLSLVLLVLSLSFIANLVPSNKFIFVFLMGVATLASYTLIMLIMNRFFKNELKFIKQNIFI